MAVLFLFGGCNGAGKTTVALPITQDLLGQMVFLNADIIASNISLRDPQRSAGYAASKILLQELRQLVYHKQNFALESTLSSVTLAHILRQCKSTGYMLNLIYLWLESPELAYERVQKRAQLGGHYVSKTTVFRRYYRSVVNLHQLYIPLFDNFWVYDNSGKIPILVSRKKSGATIEVYEPSIWARIGAYYQPLELGI
ncbi:MAG: zeta toxin family protein [Bacteroidia bacterium]|nr:zeta toxin family protein [Bacteroidia bacterium]MDW8159673.1 zeta toxin family protein [Bacteroidia bacterium]